MRNEDQRADEEEALEELAGIVGLDTPPDVIDCFDVSNFQGAHVVASRVRFRRGHADRSGYRRFKVRGVEGQDDFAAMKEVVGRSLRRSVEEDDVPDLGHRTSKRMTLGAVGRLRVNRRPGSCQRF